MSNHDRKYWSPTQGSKGRVESLDLHPHHTVHNEGLRPPYPAKVVSEKTKEGSVTSSFWAGRSSHSAMSTKITWKAWILLSLSWSNNTLVRCQRSPCGEKRFSRLPMHLMWGAVMSYFYPSQPERYLCRPNGSQNSHLSWLKINKPGPPFTSTSLSERC